MRWSLMATALLIASCSPEARAPGGNASTGDTPSGTLTPDGTRYLGRWIGVEGMMLEVKAGADGALSVQNRWDLDSQGSYPARATAAGLQWTRGEETVTAVPGDGAATGLKWLARKRDCLVVKPSEGYCRD